MSKTSIRGFDKNDSRWFSNKELIRLKKTKYAKFYLDSPVSNSGNLKCKILECFKDFNVEVDVELVNNADVILEKLDRIVTSDAAILDKCISYFNVFEEIIKTYMSDVYIIDLS